MPIYVYIWYFFKWFLSICYSDISVCQMIDGSIDIDSSRYMDTQSFKYAGNVINKNHLLNTSQLDLSHLYHMKILDPF